MAAFPLLKSFKSSTNIFLWMGFTALFFDLNYWVMKNLLGTDPQQLQCLPGGGLTLGNIVFAFGLSLIMGAFVVGLKTLFMTQRSWAKKGSALSIFSVSGFLGFFTVFCPVCTIGVVSLFGVSFGLNFFLDYNFYIKILSLVLLLFGLYWINQQLKKDCAICHLVSLKKEPK